MFNNCLSILSILRICSGNFELAHGPLTFSWGDPQDALVETKLRIAEAKRVRFGSVYTC